MKAQAERAQIAPRAPLMNIIKATERTGTRGSELWFHAPL
jgi:hypothetical protein